MKKILYIFLLLTTIVSFGQRKYAADKHFNKFNYTKAIELYEGIAKKGDSSYLVLSRIGDANFSISNFTEAEKWYQKLTEGHLNEITQQHLFRYAQTLKSNGKVTASDKWLLKIKQMQANDSRVLALEQNKDYYQKYTTATNKYVNLYNLTINTKYSDFGGFIHKDKFYFASTKPAQEKKQRLYSWNNQPYLDLYTGNPSKTTQTSALDITEAEAVSALNSPYHESNAVLTKDGKTMYFTRDNFDGSKLKSDKKRISHLKIYKTTKVGNEWRNLKELPFNSDNYSSGHPALSIDEKTLYFVSDMPGGIGATDLYKVAILENDQYGDPENLGGVINTEGEEKFPYIASNGHLFFASNGHLGLGGLDVFEAGVNEKNEFLAPVNMGIPINGPRDDFGLVLNNEITKGFFSTNREGGKGDDDIYSFELYKCVQVVEGVIKDREKEIPLAGAIVQLINRKGEVVAERKAAADGSYTFNDVECKIDLEAIVAFKADYKEDRQLIKINKTDFINGENRVVANASLEKKEEKPVVIDPIYFGFDKYTINQDAKKVLNDLVDIMQNNVDLLLTIESHADSRGSKTYNLLLSERRAKATKEYLISKGINASRILNAKGFGEEKNQNLCDDSNSLQCNEEQHKQNRSSRFYLSKK